jgi:hypothetical protein
MLKCFIVTDAARLARSGAQIRPSQRLQRHHSIGRTGSHFNLFKKASFINESDPAVWASEDGH